MTNNSQKFEIGICVQEDDNIYSLAIVRFNPNKMDVVVSQNYGDYMKAGAKSFDPHWTYHGKDGESHTKSYGKNIFGRKRQPLDISFKDYEIVATQAFGYEYAKALKLFCKSNHTHILLNSRDIPIKEQSVERHGKILKSFLPTSIFQVVLLEPGKTNLIRNFIKPPERIISQQVFRNTSPFPWCVITIASSI